MRFCATLYGTLLPQNRQNIYFMNVGYEKIGVVMLYALKNLYYECHWTAILCGGRHCTRIRCVNVDISPRRLEQINTLQMDHSASQKFYQSCLY